MGKAIGTVAGLPAVSVTVTVAVAVAGLAVSGVPVMIAGAVSSMVSPEGRPVASYPSMSVAVVLGVMAVSRHAHLEGVPAGCRSPRGR